MEELKMRGVREMFTSKKLHRFLNLDWLRHRSHRENLSRNKPDEIDWDLRESFLLIFHRIMNKTHLHKCVQVHSNVFELISLHFHFSIQARKDNRLNGEVNISNELVELRVNSLLYTLYSNFWQFVFPMRTKSIWRSWKRIVDEGHTWPFFR